MYNCQLTIPIDGIPTTVEVVYPNHEDNDEHLAASLERLVEAYNRRIAPSRLMFICPSGVENRIQRCFDARRCEFEGRLASTSHILVAPYDERGQLAYDRVLHLTDVKTDWQITDNCLEQLGSRAVARVFDDTKTILNAPHGYVFRKLSGREEDIFVRAGNMLREPSCLAVFNHLLLRRLPPDCSLLYIDSFTILSFALSLQSLVGYFRRLERVLSAFAIENIHSYEMAPEFRIPNEPNYFVLISASTSGGLARKLIEENQADPARIVHLLGVGPPSTNLRDSSVYFRERYSTHHPRSAAGQQNAIIEIGTEEFLVAQGPPRPVAITRAHINRDGYNELHKPFYQKALKFNEPGPRNRGSYSTFSLSTSLGNLDKSPIRSWVCEKLVHELPASVKTIVHVDDHSSGRMALWLGQALGEHVKTKSLSELKNQARDSRSNGGAIVVVAHHDPRLEGLREANIVLRRMEDIHRHYVIGYCFPASRTEHRRLMTDLRMGRSGPQYGWSEYLILPVGADPVHESLLSLGAPLNTDSIEEQRATLGDGLTDALVNRRNRVRIPSDGLFLPRTNGAPLMLRHGSVFFPAMSTASVSQIVVYAMVCAALQAARESRVNSGRSSAVPAPGFDDNPFVRTVLDPSMFARFSDGILQASLLRATQRSELDYSASEDLSRQFSMNCRSVLLSHRHGVGDAALEFIHALATEKVALRSTDRQNLHEEIQAIPILEAIWRSQELM